MSSTSPTRRWTIFLTVAMVVLEADLLSKEMVLRGHWSGPVIPGLLDITHVSNPGAAFGLFPGARILFIVIKSLAVVVILTLVARGRLGRRGFLTVPLAMIMGGALGNLVDRFRGTGEVIDFIDFSFRGQHWYIFNVADACISVGAVLVGLYLLFGERGRGDAEPLDEIEAEPSREPAE